MASRKTNQNFSTYDFPSLGSEVDPERMRSIFEEQIQKLSFYSSKDYFDLWKPKKEELRFQYYSIKQLSIQFCGSIYARESRRLREFTLQVPSFMRVDVLDSDNHGELRDAVKKIITKANIEKAIL